MDPMTQSAQISSSQGLADGHNSAVKESKLSDSFLSSSPVSLIPSPQDKRVIPGADKTCEGVATSLRFPSQPGSFSPGNFGNEAESSDVQPDSPIKTSPVSERIKALEALAAQKREPDFRSDGSFTHFKDRHHEKSPTENAKSPTGISKSSVEASKSSESPGSPFELLGDLRQANEFEETEEWMKAHSPPGPHFDAVELIKGTNNVPPAEGSTNICASDTVTTFAGVPDAFMDSPVESSKPKEEFSDAQKQPAVEEEFDISFLPTAYVWDPLEKSGVPAPSNLDSVSPPAPPGDFASDDKQNVSDSQTSLVEDLEHPQASEVDSSGESDDTVIEDGVSAPPSALPSDNSTTDPSSTVSDPEKVVPPPKSERKLMTVPTINVIETDEPNYSDEEMEIEAEEDEDYEILKDPVREIPKTSVPEPENGTTDTPKTRPLETEFMEGYSPPSSPVDSDAEYSPKHNILTSSPETGHEPSPLTCSVITESTVSVDSPSDFSQAQIDTSETTSNEVSDERSPSLVKNEEKNEEVDFPDNDDEWSDEVQDVLVEPCKKSAPYNQSKVDEKERPPISISSFMQDDIYDRQSFDYDYDISSPLEHGDDKGLSNAKERFLSDPTLDDVTKDMPCLDSAISMITDEDKSSLEEYPQNPYSCFQTETRSSSSNEQDFKDMSTNIAADNMKNDNTLPSPKSGSNVQQETKADLNAPDTSSSQDGINDDSSVPEPMDSFVEFMRECLKSRQDEDPEDVHQAVSSENEVSRTSLLPSQISPSSVMDLEQEKLTITALKELGSSQDEQFDNLQPKQLDENRVNPTAASAQPLSLTAVPDPSCSQRNRVFDDTNPPEVETIDEWVAEAYHLAEHVLTAILTHLSVKDLIHWRDPKKTGLMFGLSLLVLLSLAAFSVISVVSYLLLSLLCVTITFRIYKSVVQAVQKSSDGHPFKTLIDKDVSIPPETFRKHVDTSLTYINRALKQMSRLFLVEDLVDSLKLAVVMWLLTYVGAVFNGITVLILADILLFAVPPVYEKNKTQVDQYIDLVRTQVNTTMAKLQEKLPGAVKRSKTE
ncbi:reticulon-3 isoform X2 [Cololabis saira]|uniref:reticulon-3 isoform X2 n=1 Tax=Cololabis saira TaxID=129043 RepID=UPI002AD2A9C9|nr:reticulon-3 isoform X2 [Cololabis saira]